MRSPLEGQDSVGAASAFYPPRPRGPDEGAALDEGASLRPWPGGGGQGRRRPSDGQGWAEPSGPREDAPGPVRSHICPPCPCEPRRWGSREPKSRGVKRVLLEIKEKGPTEI